MIPVTCPHCSLKILVPYTVQGKAGVCFACGNNLVVPPPSGALLEAHLAFSRGERISERYIIQDRVGQGGMGVVYKAHDQLVDECIALKFMHPGLLSSARGQQLFIQEAQVARRLRHENIVTVHDVSRTEEGVLYLSMEFVRGRSLREPLIQNRQARKPVGVRMAVTLVSQVLDALGYAHRTVVHRDIKPENIMLMPGERVKVLDFGLAKAVYEETPVSGNSTTGARGQAAPVGTLAYAAPEQKQRHEVDLRADIYSTGLLLHELLTLRTPLDKPVTVAQVRPDVAPSIVAVLDKAMQTDRESRWQSAEAFRTALLQAFDESYRKTAAPAFGTTKSPDVSTEGMVFIEGGNFLMGNNDVREEAPEFELHTRSFYMDRHPVTVEQYRAFLDDTGHNEPEFWNRPGFDGPKQPVIGVTWEDACTYAGWSGKQLPSEAQWEYAARGKENRIYPWGDQDPSSVLCNFGDYLSMPTNVTMHDDGCTPEGLLDMAGNIYEWTLDCFLPYDPSRGEAPATEGAPRRVVRGGAWNSSPDELRCSHRKGLFPESRLPYVGFRCVVPTQD